jgi:Zn-finger nucleic acid-binding protein
MTLVAGRGYYTCAYCTTFYFPAPNDDYVRVLAEPVGMACPLCHGELVAAMVAETQVACCRRCRGILANRLAFGAVVGYLRSRATTPPTPPRPVDHAQLARRLPCPQCGRAMDVHPYYGPGNIVIDTCAACELLWLDHGELASVIDAPGRDRRVER